MRNIPLGVIASSNQQGAGTSSTPATSSGGGASPLVGYFATASLENDITLATSDTSPYTIPWDFCHREGMTSAWSTSNRTRLTVPTGVTEIRIIASVTDATIGFNDRPNKIELIKNGTFSLSAGCAHEDYKAEGDGDSEHTHFISTGIIDVTAGDYFELNWIFDDQAEADIAGGSSFLGISWFEMEIVQ